MGKKIFTKRHPEAARQVSIPWYVRVRIWRLMESSDPWYDSRNSYGDDLSHDMLANRLMNEHGWTELRTYRTPDDWSKATAEEFILKGVVRFVLDACELYSDLLEEIENGPSAGRGNPSAFQSELNRILEEANLPWRMLEGRVIKVDSQWLETEIHAKAAELLAVSGFEGALSEFQDARSCLSSGDHKGAIRESNLAIESTIKVILGLEQEKPGTLIRKLIDSKLVPEYYTDFLKVFEQDILRSVSVSRNFEPGVGHGQGAKVSEPPRSLAELVVNLSGVLMLYLLKLYLERHPLAIVKASASEPNEEDLPF